MSKKSALDRLAEYYDSADTAPGLDEALAARDPDAPPAAERMMTFAVRLPVGALDRVREVQALLELIGRAPRESAGH